MWNRFPDRSVAGRQLGAALTAYRRTLAPEGLVLALPRGGVPVGFEVARALDQPLDILVVRKLGVPGHPELAMGAIATGGATVLNEHLVRALRIPADSVTHVIQAERAELERREHLFRGERLAPEVKGRTVIVVDDGLATGSTVEAAIGALRTLGPARIVVAVPVAPEDTCRRLRPQVDDLVCLMRPEPFLAVGRWYQRFDQVDDEEVRRYLALACAPDRPAPSLAE